MLGYLIDSFYCNLLKCLMLSIANLTMQYGDAPLFENVSLSFYQPNRYGIVGANGSGKSTLLRLLLHEVPPTEGEVSIPQDVYVAALKQDHFQYEDQSPMEVVLQGNPELWKALKEKESLLESEDAQTNDTIGYRLGELEETIAHHDGYNAEHQAAEILQGLGLELKQHHQPMSLLSGGFKLRALLAQTLFRKPEILLLDEPTNHLDIVSIYWLEEFLKKDFQGVLLVVSHDRYFLNSVTTHIVDVDYGTMQIYTGDYDQFVQAKALDSEQREREASNQEKKIAHMQAFVDRFKAKATKARQAQSRVKQIEKMEAPEIRYSTRVSPSFNFQAVRPSGKDVLQVKELSKNFGEKQVLCNVSFEVSRGDKVAIIGPNGIGKSTLLKICMEHLTASKGKVEWGYEAQKSYFAQDLAEDFRHKTSVYEWLYQFAPQESVGKIRSYLGRVLFSGDDVHKFTNSLSGGESARLMLAKIMLTQPNVILLDEPTNHLDMESLEALENALQHYEHTLLFVSHDRRFVGQVATKILALSHQSVRYFDGTYDEYLEKYGEDYLDKDQLAKIVRQKNLPSKQALSYQERKDLQRQQNQIQKQIEKCEEQSAKEESTLAKIQQEFANPALYENENHQKIQHLTKQKQQVQQKLDAFVAQWEELSEQLEKVEAKLTACL